MYVKRLCVSQTSKSVSEHPANGLSPFHTNGMEDRSELTLKQAAGRGLWRGNELSKHHSLHSAVSHSAPDPAEEPSKLPTRPRWECTHPTPDKGSNWSLWPFPALVAHQSLHRRSTPSPNTFFHWIFRQNLKQMFVCFWRILYKAWKRKSIRNSRAKLSF